MNSSYNLNIFLDSPIDQMRDTFFKDLEYLMRLKLQEQVALLPEEDRPLYSYALLPGGKFIRAKIILLVAATLQKKECCLKKKMITYRQLLNSSLLHLMLAVEIHHAYTLLHDDLPCMDNAQLRRGKLAYHLQYSASTAVLIGDALLNLSYQLWAQSSLKIVRLASNLLGAHGLIKGQLEDLNNLRKNDYLTMIYLKTARLFQLSTLAPALLYWCAQDYADLYRLGGYLGIVFQLLDDLQDQDGVAIEEGKLMIEFFSAKMNAIIKHNNWEYLNKIIDRYFKRKYL